MEHITKKKWPQVDVIIPSIWNRMQYLPDTLRSIQQQLYDHLNIIIIWDNVWMQSDWHDVSSLEKFVHNAMVGDSRIQYFLNTWKKWAAATRNVWITNSNSPLVVFADDDDLQHKKRIQLQVEKMIYENIWIIWTWGYVIDADSNIQSLMPPLQEDDKSIRQQVLYACPFLLSSTMVRRDVWDRVDWFNEDYLTSQDYKLRSDIMSLPRTFKVKNLPDRHVLYRSYESNMSHQRRQLQAINSLKISLNNFYQLPNRLTRITPHNLKMIIKKAILTMIPREQRKILKHILRWNEPKESIVVDYTDFWLPQKENLTHSTPPNDL